MSIVSQRSMIVIQNNKEKLISQYKLDKSINI